MEERGIRKARLSGIFYFRGYQLRSEASYATTSLKEARKPKPSFQEWTRMSDDEKRAFETH
jgi:hypothetical protein